MSDISDSSRKLVFDAVPSNPPISNFDTLLEKTVSQDKTKEKNTNKSNPNDSTTENTTTNSKTKNVKYSRAKKSTKSEINYNFIDCVKVKIGSTVKHVYNLNNYKNLNCTTSNKFNEKQLKPMPPNVEALNNSKIKITQNDLFIIQDHIGKGWKEFAKKLGFSQGQIEQLLEDHKHKGIREVIYHLLSIWKLSHSENSTIGNLIYALWSAEEYECVEKLAETHSVL